MIEIISLYIESVIYVAASTWGEYNMPGGWPYEFPVGSTYVKGEPAICCTLSIAFKPRGRCL